MRFTLRNLIMLGVFAALLVLIGTPIGYVWLGMSNSGGMGSMTEAVKLRPVVEAMPEPAETFGDRNAETVGIRFPNGEWVVGVTKDSHALYSKWHGGGTVVLKDSCGRVRCFFGHVCGVGNFMLPDQPASLDAFDAGIVSHFAEQQWPQRGETSPPSPSPWMVRGCSKWDRCGPKATWLSRPTAGRASAYNSPPAFVRWKPP